MNKEFAVHMLNEAGKAKAAHIAEAFDRLLVELTTPATPNDDPEDILCPPSREASIMRIKLEEACFFAKKAMASSPENTTTRSRTAPTRRSCRCVLPNGGDT